MIKEAESNIYSGVNLLNGTIVFLWTLLGLSIIGNIRNVLYAAVSGGVFYLSLVLLCIILFKGVIRYLSFPEENKKMPVFMGYKPDTIFIYPILLMSLIGIVSNLLTATGFFPAALQQTGTAGVRTMEIVVRIMFLPLVAFAEELLNLIIVSFFYMNMKLLRNFRLIASIISAALIFGMLHSFGWGMNAAILIAIAYLPVFLVTLYTGNIWISFLAHFYNDLISFTKLYYGSYHYVIIAAVTFIPAVWAVRALFRKPR